MTTISFMTANYVARPVAYHMTDGWMQGDTATNDYFKPIATFADRFDAYLADIHAMGFAALDIWIAILNPLWATPEHIQIAAELLQKRQLQVVSLAGGFGNSLEDFEKTCQLATALNTRILGGSTGLLHTNRTALVARLRHYGLVFGLENHPEKSPEELLQKIGDADSDVMGATVDTGWFGTHNMNAPQALHALAKRILHVHLKDVKAPGGHETCRYESGCVGIAACVQTLKDIGYTGAISIEHEPEHFDPTEDVIASFAALKGWLTA